MPRTPDLVVTSVAALLVEATGANATRVSEKVLGQFDLDAAYLRHHDRDIRGSVLVAEWPQRVNVPDPDPLAVVHFGSADQGAVLRINVAPAQLITRGFVRCVADTIDEFGIDGGSVCLEVTERAVVGDIDTARTTLTDLKEVGVQIAIDDFGTGYAVLSHLKSLPVDILKIDSGFVADLGTDAGDLAIVQAIIGLAEAFGLQVVAEGVETPAAAMTLMQLGCHRAQGSLLSKPVPGGAMEALLSARWMPMPFLADRGALSAGAI